MAGTALTLASIGIMGAVIFLCRSLPFFLNALPFFDKFKRGMLAFVEKTAPPVAMAVLAVNTLALPVKQNIADADGTNAVPVLICAAVCALLHIIKRNVLVSIFVSTALYMALIRLS